jgi:hypothetical protein
VTRDVLGGVLKCLGSLFHVWGRWEEYQTKLTRRMTSDRLTGTYLVHDPPIETTETWEKRRCSDCGRTQHRQTRNF